MARITTSKGEARLRPMLGNEELILSDMVAEGDKMPFTTKWSLTGRMLRALDAGLESADWEGGFGVLPSVEVVEAFLRWNMATDEDAVPEGSEPSSETPTAGPS